MDVLWQKSTYSGGGEGDNCVELAATAPGEIALRESDAPGAVIATTPAALARLIAHLKTG